MGYTLAVLGCGTMGIAVTSGVLLSLEEQAQSSSSSCIPENTLPSRFIATVGRKVTHDKLRGVFDVLGQAGKLVEIQAGEGNLKAVKEADVIILASKPYMAKTILSEPGLTEALRGKTLISICAGVTISQLKSWVPEDVDVIRAMPNTPCKIREGMTAITPVSDPKQQSILSAIFSSCGRCRFLEEKHFDTVTALAGSGPAFISIIIEAMTDGAVMMGMPVADAREMAAQMVQGTGKMVLQSGLHPAQLKDSVTTPGGCTIAGLLTMEDGKVRSSMARTVQVATKHAAGLGQDSKK